MKRRTLYMIGGIVFLLANIFFVCRFFGVCFLACRVGIDDADGVERRLCRFVPVHPRLEIGAYGPGYGFGKTDFPVVGYSAK